MKERILVIDDDPTLVRVLQVGLEKEGYEAISATSGAEGLRQAYSTQPHLIILDIMMPRMDGWEVCRRLREMSDVPIIMLTAKVREEDIVKGLGLGADDYITKPFRTRELMARMEALLRRASLPPSSQNSPVFTNGDLTVDFDRHRVKVRGKEVDLTPKEFRLLSCLVHNRGQVVPHRTILTQAWGPAYANALDYVKLYISYLRRKIEEDPSDPQYVLTEWGVGYYLAA
jgi:two-component system KDP operon response regulator KdpE